MNFITYTRDDVLKALRENKTSIAYGQKEREKILSNPNLAPLLEGLKSAAASYREKPIKALSFHNFKLYDETGNHGQFENEYFTHRGMLEIYALMAWIYEDEDYLHALEDIIWAVCDEYSWPVPAHMGSKSLSVYQEENHNVDLFAAETGQAFAEILSLLGDKLHPTVKMRMKKRLEERIFGRLDQPFAWKEVKICNWAAVCAGSVGMAAMYEIEDDERLADIIMICLTSMDRFIGGYTADGVCTEGIAYWGYGFGYFMYFADMLSRRTGGALNLFDIDKVHLMATLIGKVFFPNGRCVSFSDGGSRSKMDPSIISKLATIYPDMPIADRETMRFAFPVDTCYRFAHALRQFVWMRSEDFIPTEEADNTFIFPDAQWYLSTSKNGISIAAKAGHNQEAHNHNDVGSFQIFKNGQQFLADLGAGVYDKFYFSGIRYSIFCAGSQGHNVPIINGKTQESGRNHTAENVVIERTGMHYDFHHAYEVETLDCLHRDLFFDEESGITKITDTYSFSEAPSALVERYVTLTEPKLGDGIITIDVDGVVMALHYDKSAWTPSVYVEKKTRGGENYESISYAIDFTPTKLEKAMSFSLEIK